MMRRILTKAVMVTAAIMCTVAAVAIGVALTMRQGDDLWS